MRSGSDLALLESARFDGQSDPSPFLKWAGGKTQLLNQIERLLPKEFSSYAEPFLGSAAVFFYLRRLRGTFPATLTDSNEELVNCFVTVRDEVNRLIPLLEEHRRLHSRERYYAVRNQQPSELSHLQRAARLIYLNKTCFNGLYRVNSRGQFNVPMGSYAQPRIFDADALRAASEALAGTQIHKRDYADIESFVDKGSFVYLDPPYHPISRTSNFTGYAVRTPGLKSRKRGDSATFGIDEQQRVAATFTRLDKIGCSVMLSNSDSPILRKYYSEFRVRRVAARRIINCDGTKRGAIHEIIVRNYD